MKNPLHDLAALGQSVWYDNIRRSLIESGELARLIADDAVTGVTSNPSIFEKAILGSPDYDAQIEELASSELGSVELYQALALEDIGRAADVLAPVWERTQGRDGFVSIEVSPELADSTNGTVEAAQVLAARLGRPNVMIKVPATSAGVSAIEQLVAAGLSINVTLIFSLDVYEQVAEAYIAGLEQRAQRGESVGGQSSVASFFVSRVDTKVDRALEERGRADLAGRAAVANARLAYDRFRAIFGSERFAALERQGARPQRPLWASTGTKNPAYSDVKYVEELAGPDTVNTMPLATLCAFRDHGSAANALDGRAGEAEKALAAVADAGVDVGRITDELLEEGVQAFGDAFAALLAGIEKRRAAVLSRCQHPIEQRLGALEQAVRARVATAQAEGWLARLWRHDPTLWTNDQGQYEEIRNRLGWLGVVGTMLERADELETLAGEVVADGFTHVAVLGMGGSSLGPDVLARTFGRQAGRPELLVLDSTDPEAVAAFDRELPTATTLFLVSSKSGTTTEPLDFYRYFRRRVESAVDEGAGGHFIAITDPGTPLEALAGEQHFRRVFKNPPDIGGRYSVLSYFGLVPAALAGIDVRRLLHRAECALHTATTEVEAADSPGLVLGAALGEAALAGRDKVTFAAAGRYRSFGAWAEQLIAESTGKEGKGIVPVDGEGLASPETYGDDRLFVRLAERDSPDPEQDRALAALADAGHPVVTILLDDPYDLGGQFVLWELAVAIASAVLGINAFDQPNVQAAKDITKRLLGEVEQGREVAAPAGAVAADDPELPARIGDHLAGAGPGRYVSLQAYLPPTVEVEGELRTLQREIRDATRAATTLGFGPRFLHSTGQLHKGGPASGIFVQLALDHADELPVPGRRYGFRTLEAAQSVGDFEAIEERGRPVLRIELAQAASGLAAVRRAVENLTVGAM